MSKTENSAAAIHDPSWCARVASDLDAADARAAALMQNLSAEQLNWKPSAQVWSVGQCMEHLCLANEVYAEPMAEALEVRRSASVDEIRPDWFGRWFIRTYIEPMTQKSRARAPRKATPIARQIDASILDRFVASNAMIRDIIDRAREVDVNHVRFRNPYVPLIRFTIGTGLQIIARHNHRHLGQAERVRQSPEFP